MGTFAALASTAHAWSALISMALAWSAMALVAAALTETVGEVAIGFLVPAPAPAAAEGFFFSFTAEDMSLGEGVVSVVCVERPPPVRMARGPSRLLPRLSLEANPALPGVFVAATGVAGVAGTAGVEGALGAVATALALAALFLVRDGDAASALRPGPALFLGVALSAARGVASPLGVALGVARPRPMPMD